MAVLLLCIACNVLLAIIFKGFHRYGLNNLNAIVVNYFVCVVVASAVLGASSVPFDVVSRPWFWWSVILSLTFITGFNVLALSFQKSGVALTAIIQKMSLAISAAFAILYYGESLGWMKAIGILLALVAVFLVNLPKKGVPAIKWNDPVILLPISTLIISGFVEIVLYIVEAEAFVQGDNIEFVATSFGMAGLWGLFYTIWELTKGVK
ncbi:MAG: EamA family transporter, partial [Bacteroidota bacterium]